MARKMKKMGLIVELNYFLTKENLPTYQQNRKKLRSQNISRWNVKITVNAFSGAYSSSIPPLLEVFFETNYRVNGTFRNEAASLSVTRSNYLPNQVFFREFIFYYTLKFFWITGFIVPIPFQVIQL